MPCFLARRRPSSNKTHRKQVSKRDWCVHGLHPQECATAATVSAGTIPPVTLSHSATAQWGPDGVQMLEEGTKWRLKHRYQIKVFWCLDPKHLQLHSISYYRQICLLLFVTLVLFSFNINIIRKNFMVQILISYLKMNYLRWYPH